MTEPRRNGARRHRSWGAAQIAAQIIVESNQDEGLVTPLWTRYLAEGKNLVGEERLPDGSNWRLSPEKAQFAAQIRMEDDQMRGEKTPQWLVDFAEGKHLLKKAEAQAS